MASKYFKAFNAIKNLVKGGKNVSPTITSVKPKSTEGGRYKARNLKEMGKAKRSLDRTEAKAKKAIAEAKTMGRRDLAVGSAKSLRDVKRAQRQSKPLTKAILKPENYKLSKSKGGVV